MITSEADFNRYSISVADLEQSKRFLTEAANHVPNTVTWDALMFAAIVAYCRPFGSNEVDEGAAATKRLPKEVRNGFSEAQVELHEECCRVRSKALAHSEHALNPTAYKSETQTVVTHPFTIPDRTFSPKALLPLVEHLLEVCERERADYRSREARS